MEFSINHMTPVLFGTDASRQTGPKLNAFGCTNVLFVYDQGVKKTGIPDKVMANVKELGIRVSVYDGVQADPPDYTVDQGAEIGRRENVDGVVGIGGGSTMDTAKAINLLLTNPGVISQYFVRGVVMKPGKVLVLIPTTSGTGSEVTHFCVLTDSKEHRKKGPAGNLMRATLAIVDPLLTVGMPPSITADTGTDAFAHAAEALTSAQANPMSDILGERAISLATKYLPKAVKDGSDIEARIQMSFAAMTAGYAFNDSITHLGHGIGHALGSMYHIPHGNACGVALPEIMEFVAEASPEGVKRVAAAMGIKVKKGASPSEVGAMVRDSLAAFNLGIGQKTLRQLNVPGAELSKVAEVAAGPGPSMFSPKKAGADDILKILQKAYAR